MALDVRTAQTTLENLLRDTILYALGARLPQVASVAALRAITTMGANSTSRTDDDLVTVAGSPATAYRWSQVSQAADNGTTVIKPTDAGISGRWLAWTSRLRFSPTVGADSVTLDQIISGPLARVIVLDKSMTEDEVAALLTGQVPAVTIEAAGDSPSEGQQNTGMRWLTDYEFNISVLAENLRDRREAAQGTTVPNDSTYGANTIDGLLKALLCSTQLDAALADNGIRDVRIGHAHNWISDLGQRRTIRSRAYTVAVTELFPNAPNEVGAAEGADAQAQMTTPNEALDAPTTASDFIVGGMLVTQDIGLTQSVSAGSAQIDGVTVDYAGGLVVFTAYSDTYRDLLPDGTMTFVTVSATTDPPAVTATALRIGVCRTNGGGVILDRYLAATKQNYMNRFVHNLD